MKKSLTRTMSVFLSVIMLLTAIPLYGSAEYNAGGTGYAEYKEMAYAEGFYDATVDQLASFAFDCLDYVLGEIDSSGDEHVFEIAEGVEVDFSVVDTIDEVLAEIVSLVNDKKLGGSFDELDVSAIEDASRAMGDLKLGYAMIEMLADNSTLLASILTGDFDFGKVAESYPVLDEFRSLNFNALILDAIGLDPADDDRMTVDELIQSMLSPELEALNPNLTLDLLEDTIYDFANSLIGAFVSNDLLTETEVTATVQSLRYTVISLVAQLSGTLLGSAEFRDGDEPQGTGRDFAAIKQLFIDTYNTPFPTAAIKATDTISSVTCNAYYIPVSYSQTDETGDTTVESYVAVYTQDIESTDVFWVYAPDSLEQQEALRQAYGETAPSGRITLWTYEGENYMVYFTPSSDEDPDGYTFYNCFKVGGIPVRVKDDDLIAQIKADGDLIKEDAEVAAFISQNASLITTSEIPEFSGLVSDDAIRAETGYEDSYKYSVDRSVSDTATEYYSYNGVPYIRQSGTVKYTVSLNEYNAQGGYYTSVPQTTVTKQEELMYQFTDDVIPELMTKLDPCFNFDIEALGASGTENGGLIGELNNIIVNAVKMLLTDEAEAELDLVAGGNENISANLDKLVEGYWGSIAGFFEVLAGGDVDDFPSFFNEIEYDENTGLQGFVISWMKWIFNSPDAMGGEFVTLGDDVETVGQFAGICLYELFSGITNSETSDDLFEGFEFNYESKVFDEEGKVLDKSNAQWIDIALDMCVDIGVFLLNKYVPNVGLDTAKVAEYKAAGWGWFDFLDEVVDWALRFVDGVVAISADFDRVRGVTDGNGPWYKLSAILSDVLAPLAIFNCGKTYGTDNVPFDLGTLLVDDILTGALNLDIGKILSFLETNTSESNIFYSNAIEPAALKTVQKAVNSILPGTIVDADITSIEQLLKNETLASVGGNALLALNARKAYIIPAALEIIAKTGLLDDVFTQGRCGDNLTWKCNALESVLQIYGYGEMYNAPDFLETRTRGDFWTQFNFDTVEFIADEVNGGVTSIGGWAFYGSSFTNITIPDTVTTIGDYAFYCCNYMEDFVIPDGVTSIGDYAFWNCPLYSVSIPKSVNSIGLSAFEVAKLYDVFYSGTQEEWAVTTAGGNGSIPDTATIHYGNVTDKAVGIYFNLPGAMHDGVLYYYGISLAQTHTVSAIHAVVTGAGNFDKAVVYSSDSPEIASVDASTGSVTGVSPGTARITATSVADSSLTTFYVVEVEAKLESFTVTPSQAILAVGETQELTPVFEPADVDFSWWYQTDSDAANVITLERNYYEDTLSVTAVAPGTATITLCAEDESNNEMYFNVEITVVDEIVYVTSVSLSPETLTLDSGDTATLSATVLPYNATNSNVTYKSSDEAIAKVSSNGTVTAYAPGEATITVTTADGGFTDTCAVTVTCNTHLFGDWTVRTAATCTAEGVEYRICACGAEETRAISKLAHTPSDWIIDTEATCTAVGSKHKECTVCNEILETEDIPVTDHTFGEWTVLTAATCTAEGVEYRTCVCGAEETRAISKLAHTLSDWIIDTEATCTASGSKHKECTVCHEILETEEISATGHTFGSWTVRTAATCTAEGVEYRTCACGAEETRAISKLSHVQSGWIIDTEATCTAAGSKHIECTVCHVTLSTEAISATGHHDNGEGYCSDCGADLGGHEEPEQDNSFIGKIKAFFQKIIDFFKNLFN